VPQNHNQETRLLSVTDFGDVGRGQDDADALIKAIDKAQKSGIGTVAIPGCILRTRRTITLPADIWLRGEGYGSSAVMSADDVDIPVLVIDGSDGGVEGLGVFGRQGADARSETAKVNPGVVGSTMRDCRIWGGSWGLVTAGVDCYVTNCFIQGAGSQGGNILSSGANWYDRLKCDDGGQPHKYGFWQQWNSTDGSPAENHFDQSDFTGNFTEGAIRIDDAGYNSNITHFSGCVFNSRCLLYNTRWTGFTGCEIGADVIVGNGACTITGSYGFGIKAIGAVGAGNVGITT
jgi:hypothetical protein